MATISEIVNVQACSFDFFLRRQVLDNQICSILDKLLKHSDVYVLSGVIRDFLTGSFSGIRDLDFVITESEVFTHLLDLLSSMTSVKIKRNHFGGIKLITPKLQIDLWYLKDTWGIKNQGLPANVHSLIDSVFFNFSAIAFVLKEKKFVFNHHFCRFLESGVLDVVYDQNPNIPLCIVNTFHYSNLYGYNISVKLARWILTHYHVGMNLLRVQEEHFGQVLYDQKDIVLFVKNLRSQLNV